MNEQQLRAARARMMAARGDELTRRAVETTFVIYQEDNQGRPDAWGTGVLLSIGPVRFVLSAGHVIARGKERRLSVGVPLSLAPVHGELTTLGREGTGNGDEDDIDVAAIRLDPAGWSHVDPSCFLEWHELDHSPIQVTRDSLALLGFPTTKQRHGLKGDSLTATAFQALGKECLPGAYTAEGRDYQTSIMLGLDRRRVWGASGQETAPTMYGMSGSGIWRIGADIFAADASPRLSAIVIQYPPRAKVKHFLGTRVTPILDHLALRYSEVGDFLRAHQ